MKNLPPNAVYAKMHSPVGNLWIIASDRGLHALCWECDGEEIDGRLKEDFGHPVLKKAVRQLKEYFNGRRKSFDLPLAAAGTSFQKRAWRELSRIPYGQTISYGEQARRMGDVKKARAVGMANARNPIGIVVPCHRVIAGTGALSGFGGGVHNKQLLLELERGR